MFTVGPSYGSPKIGVAELTDELPMIPLLAIVTALTPS